MFRGTADLGQAGTARMKEFLGTYAAYHDVEESTIQQYQYVLNCFGRFLGREPQFIDLNPDQVNAWLTAVKGTLSPHTIKTRRMTILSIWKTAADLGLVAPPRMVRQVKVPKRVVTALSRSQVVAMFQSASQLHGRYNGYLWRDLVRTWLQAVLETAMRPGDMRSLEWLDVVRMQGRLTIIQEKTGIARRVVLSTSLMSDIASWHAASGLVWPLGCKYIMGRKIKAVGVDAGIPGVTHTLLRQTAISDVEQQQPGVGWVFAGHASPDTTRNWYIDRESAYRDIPRPRF